MVKRIKFSEYKLTLRGREPLCILVPHDITRMWVLDGYRSEEYGTDIQGDADAMRALMYSFAVLMNDPYKIIYFPIRDNRGCKGCGYAAVRNDVVFMTHNVKMRVKDWKEYRRLIMKKKPETYVLRYDRRRIDAYAEDFTKNRVYENEERWSRFNGFEKLNYDTVFMCMDSVAYIDAYIGMRRYLDCSLDSEFIRSATYPYMPMICLPYRVRSDPKHAHESDFYMEAYYINEHLVKERNEYQKKRGMLGANGL